MRANTNSIVQEFLAGLEHRRNVAAHYAQIEEWARLGQTDVLVTLARMLADREQRGTRDQWQIQAVYDYLERAVALTRGSAQVEILLRLLPLRPVSHGYPHQTPDGRARAFASLLAFRQPVRVLAQFLAQHVADDVARELLSCLVQEMVLRHEHAGKNAAVTRYAESMRARAHPLAWLPLTRLPIERDIDLPSYSYRSSGHSVPFGPINCEDDDLSDGALESDVAAADVTEDATRQDIVEPFARWKVEAGVFTFPAPLPAEHIAASLLQRLGLRSLAGNANARVRMRPVSAADAFRVLFAAAAYGGVYGGGRYGAYGRLSAWRSLAALAGASSSAPIQSIAVQAETCTWASFDATTEWFYARVWDVGLLALRPDCRSLAIVAATTTD